MNKKRYEKTKVAIEDLNLPFMDVDDFVEEQMKRLHEQHEQWKEQKEEAEKSEGNQKRNPVELVKEALRRANKKEKQEWRSNFERRVEIGKRVKEIKSENIF